MFLYIYISQGVWSLLLLIKLTLRDIIKILNPVLSSKMDRIIMAHI